MKLCPHCMKQTDSGEFCVHCGKELKIGAEVETGQLPVGTLLHSPDGHTYQLGAVLGQGGFGITYAAKDLNTDERVAVKEYYPSHCAVRSKTCRLTSMTGQEDSYRKGMEGFLTEARMLASVGALPCVVSVLDYFEANGTAYLVMEYVEGSALSDLMKKKGTMRADVLLPMLLPLMRDLEIIHRAGTIHRDISPDNLILMPNGTLKLLDFGSARSMQGDRTMTMLLKAGFSPIEQYQSHGQGPWTDVYALCATIYYCLTGAIPPISVDRLTRDTIVLPNAMGAGLTPNQQAALMHGLQVLQPNRTPTIQDLQRELFADTSASATFVSGHPGWQQQNFVTQPANDAVPRPAVPVQPQPIMTQSEPKKKKTGLVVLLCLIPVLLAVLGVVGWLFYQSSQDAGDSSRKCRHKETETEYQSNKDGTHDVIVICSDPECEKTVKESVEECEDSDDNGKCDACRAKVEETGYHNNAAVEQTDEGILYVMSKNGKTCEIVGYEGTETSLSLPLSIDGVETVLVEGAFENNSKIEVLDIHCKTIETGAISDCSALITLVFWEECKLEENAVVDCNALNRVSFEESCTVDYAAFSGCRALRAASYKNLDPFAASSVPSDFHTYRLGMDMGWGDLLGITVSDNVIYGYNDELDFVALDLPNDSPEVKLDELTMWVYEDALDGCSEDVVIVVGENTAYPYELYLEADWDAGPYNSFASAWYYSCYACVYAEYETGIKVRPDVELVRANMVRTEELAQSDSFNRPDGREWGSVLDDMNISWSYATCHKSILSGSEDGETVLARVEEFATACGDPIAEGDYIGQYYEKAAAMVRYENNTFYVHAIMLLP